MYRRLLGVREDEDTWWLVRVRLRLSSEGRSRRFKVNAENGEDCRNGKRFCCGGVCTGHREGSPLLPPKVDRVPARNDYTQGK